MKVKGEEKKAKRVSANERKEGRGAEVAEDNQNSTMREE